MSLPLVDIIMINEELELSPSISRVQRYLNLCFLLCLSLLRPFNLIRSEIVWQICCSLLLLTVPMGFIFFLVPCPFPMHSVVRRETEKPWHENIDGLQWNLCPRRCGCCEHPRLLSMLLSVCSGLTLAKKMWQSPIPSLCQEILQYLLCLQLLPTLTCTWAPGSAAHVSSGVGLTELKHSANVCDCYQMKSALTARPSFVEKCPQLFLEGVSPTTAWPPWHLPPSFAVVGRSSKHPEQQRADIPGSGF